MTELTPTPTAEGEALFAELRAREFSRLDRLGQVYLDYTGSGLYAESQARRHAELLCDTVLGNPHSRNPTSRAATERVEAVRARVLAFFDADPDEYEVVFTPNATGALKLVGESFPFGPGTRFALTSDNHNSVHGIREFAAARGAEVRYVPLGAELRVEEEVLLDALEGAEPGRPHLLVFPAQSNFSGVKHPLRWIARARERGWTVFLDAAAFVPTSRLSLREHRPDFACVSFYKMFGLPTGVGALLARREALASLHRPWFGGGTVRFVSAQPGVMLPWTTGRGFEDGTLNFLDIAAVPLGLDLLESIGMERVNAHVMGLTDHLLHSLDALRHADGSPAACVYGPRDTRGRGATVAFNLRGPDGRPVDFREVERRASEAGISLRSGYFCNPGAAEHALEHDFAKVRDCASHFSPESWSLQEFSVCMEERPVGAVRVSLGIPSNGADLERLLEVLRSFAR
jgi:selenocysteine lyase/cysteine desulfurase